VGVACVGAGSVGVARVGVDLTPKNLNTINPFDIKTSKIIYSTAVPEY